jgi:hypothetical protein
MPFDPVRSSTTGQLFAHSGDRVRVGTYADIDLVLHEEHGQRESLTLKR